MTSTTLKILAAILMLIDHIGEFIPGMPIYLRWIGRLSAPLFFYCSALAIHYTKNRKTYLLRLYLFSIIMGIIDLSLGEIFDSNVTNNIFRVIFTMAIIIFIIDEILEDQKKGVCLALKYLLWQMIIIIVFFVLYGDISIEFPEYVYKFLEPLEYYSSYIELLLLPILGSIINLEGGISFVILGVGMYYFCFDKKRLLVFYAAFCASHFALNASGVSTRVIRRLEWLGFDYIPCFLKYICNNIIQLDFSIPDVTAEYIFTYNYQWLMAASLPLLLLYNGKKGKGYKYFFYIFYPAHIVVLNIIGYFLFLNT